MIVRDSGRPGPIVLITGGVHGNEHAGDLAVERIAQWTPTRGQIVVLPRANRVAIERKTRKSPTGRHRDLNRDFPRKDDEPPRCDVSLEIWRYVSQLRPDWGIDLHEGVDYRVRSDESVGNSIIFYPNAETEKIAKTIHEKINATIEDETTRFALLRYPKKGSLARSCAERLGARSLILETTRKGPTDARVERHPLARADCDGRARDRGGRTRRTLSCERMNSRSRKISVSRADGWSR